MGSGEDHGELMNPVPKEIEKATAIRGENQGKSHFGETVSDNSGGTYLFRREGG